MGSGEILGLVAGALMTLGFVPQVVKVFKLRSAREISLPFAISLLAGIACWLAYGIYFRLPAVILWNAVTLFLGAALLYAKLRYG